MNENKDLALAKEIAERVAEAGGRVYLVGGGVRDAISGIPCKDVDIEVYGITPQKLREILSGLGEVLEKGAAFGVLGYLAMLSAVAYTLWALLLSSNPVSRVAVYSFLQPLFGVALGVLLGTAKDVPYLRYGAALVLVCLSIVIVVRGQREKA